MTIQERTEIKATCDGCGKVTKVSARGNGGGHRVVEEPSSWFSLRIYVERNRRTNAGRRYRRGGSDGPRTNWDACSRACLLKIAERAVGARVRRIR